MASNTRFTTELHVSRPARNRYRFDESHFSEDGRVVFGDVRNVRLFAQKINEKRDLTGDPPKEQAVKAGQLNAMALIDAILNHVADLYREQCNPQFLHQAQQWLAGQIGQEALDATLVRYVEEFPPQAVYRQEITAAAYLAGETDGIPNRELVLDDMLQIWVDNENPAASPLTELFDDANLERDAPYLQIIYLLRRYLDSQPKFGPENQNLVELLRSPAVAVPLSLAGQLQYIREHWAGLIGDFLERLLDQLLGGLDLLKEEEKAVFAGPGPSVVMDFSGLGFDAESAHYSLDREWMPRLVMIAKSTYVWLDQLSKKYQRPIIRLDQIPDEELDTLARWGFSGLWLIGLWERSRASQRIKQIMGNPEAVASAYSLFDYQIAADLGGEEAYRNLAGRAWQRGIRLASDMVPNHMGIDSTWVVNHPDWFLGLDYSPFPSYTFNGPDLSSDDRVGIFLEDHYYNHSDAAVVFKRVDRAPEYGGAGSTRYIYHGNDGTSMPWNDTAQLDYLNPAVREAVIQTILEVARRFPVIRFDAAMTLAKRHVQRLWFPQPGTGGAIASRSEHGMRQDQFDAAMPAEFWREVVERVAQEVPDTLLLAEAFWMMEGYFVRTLGMHRVYNSAFMNMLKREENAKYRTSIKNVLEYDPEILKRYVNFMNNPDEDTAVAQFGKDDKYFGVCALMVTLPGLPMIGHGQVEGYREKYGMEFRRAYWDEQPDVDLVKRHEREIFPLMQRRHVFAGVENFHLYDLYTPEGHVNEDVFAYSNAAPGDGGGERGLVLLNNKYADARGWIRVSAARVANAAANDRRLVQSTLGEALGLHGHDGQFCIFRDHIGGLEYLRSSKELCDQGLYVELGAFKYQVYLDFREVADDAEHPYAQLAASLAGRGVPSIADALRAMLEPQVAPEPVAEVAEPERVPRTSGVLLHVTSLPGRFGIGDLGDGAYRFVEFLAASGQQTWQIMPLGPTSYGDSPYQALSSMAGNPLFINLERLVEDRFLAPWDFDGAPAFPEDRVDYGPVINFKQRLLHLSYENFKANASDARKNELAEFVTANHWWLDDYALFAALKEHHGGASWSSWERDIATHQPAALERWRSALKDQIQFHHYVQFVFQQQWSSLKGYANECGIRIMGDVPIFVAYDSADAWAHPELFYFDAEGKPTLVAGVPPDYFSPTGQLWGNPLYNWDAMARDGYAWWIDRFRRALQQVDLIRLDHFRGFESCWAVPATEETAINGKWLKSPGSELFQAVEGALGPVRFIAEDLGLITPEVKALLEETGFPGMKVLQFAFSGEPDNPYLPYNYESNCVVYTGTHDNDTTIGWLNSAGETEHAALRRYLGGTREELHWAMIRLALMSVARIAIVPLQDILGIGSEGRMNTPGRAGGNWGWRFSQGMLSPGLAGRLRDLTEASGRVPRNDTPQ